MSATDLPANQAASDIDLAYCRAALCSAMALGFQEPVAETLSRLLAEESRASLASAVAMLYPNRKADLISLIDALLNGDNDDTTTLSPRYRELFGHTARGLISPYETEYGNEALFQQPQELGDLMGFYHAFGLTLKQDRRERADHVSCEFEFLMFLALKEGYALEHDNPEMLVETRKAEKLFLRDHLARFLPSFAAKLDREDPAGFYGRLAELCLQFVTAECARLQAPCGAANLGLRPADDSRVPMACGSGSECSAMPGACMPDGSDSV